MQALCRTWSLLGQGTPRQVIGRAAPQVCTDCGAVLPSKHALAAHAHRMHGRVALCTQYTLGPVCLWCLQDFHNTDRLRYHLLHSPTCEHGLRCVVGPVYEYGTGSKRRGRKGHPRAPVSRLSGHRLFLDPALPISSPPQACSSVIPCLRAETAHQHHSLEPTRSSPSGGPSQISLKLMTGLSPQYTGIALSPCGSGVSLMSGKLALIYVWKSRETSLGQQGCGVLRPPCGQRRLRAPTGPEHPLLLPPLQFGDSICNGL